MPIEETKIVAPLNTDIQKTTTKKIKPEEDFSKVLERSQSPVHTVEKGDTLWNIIRERMFLSTDRITNTKIANNVKKIVDFNRINTPDLIHPGQKFDLQPILTTLSRVPEIIDTTPDIKPVDTVTEKVMDTVPQIVLPDTITATPIVPLFPGEMGVIPLMETETPPAAETAVDDISRQTIDTKTAAEPEKTPIEPEKPKKIQPPGTLSEQMAKYKIDQLIAEPGGDFYSRNGDNVSVRPAYDQTELKGRVSKDLSDAGENIIRLFEDITKGSSRNYIGPDGEINTYQKLGLFDSLGNFVKNLSSGLSFGAYVPEGEEKPQGMDRIKHFFSKIFKEAIVKDLGTNTTTAAVSGLRHSVLAAINALEAVPDATIGNIEAGRKLTTNVFDNGQVAVSYLTDIIPGGEAQIEENCYLREFKPQTTSPKINRRANHW